MTVSVITPTQLAPERLDWLVELHDQIRGCAIRTQHVIVIDGENNNVPSALSTATVVTPGRRLGAAAARNIGLLMSEGEYVTSADDDDALPDGSLEARVAALDEFAGRGARWVAGDIVVLDETTGQQERWVFDTPYGWCDPGVTLASCPDPEGRVPVGPTTLLVDAQLLRRVGGWMALPQGEDLGMMMAVTCSAPGVMLDRVVYHYRFHSDNWTGAADFGQMEPLVRQAAWERGRACMANTIDHGNQRVGY